MGKFKNFLVEMYKSTRPKLIDSLQNKYIGPDIYIHFTNYSDNFLSLNKNPPHNDPIGIYAFPRSFILNNYQLFADKFKYAYILKSNENSKILNLNDISIESGKKILSQMGIPPEYMEDENTKHNNGDSAGHMFWGSIERWRNEPENKRKFSNRNSSWTYLFGKTQYNTIRDFGDSIIHYNEPSQIIFLSSKAYDVLDIIEDSLKSTSFVKKWIKSNIKIPLKSIKYLSRGFHGEPITQFKFENGSILYMPSPDPKVSASYDPKFRNVWVYTPNRMRNNNGYYDNLTFRVNFEELSNPDNPKNLKLIDIIENPELDRRYENHGLIYKERYLKFCETFNFSPGTPSRRNKTNKDYKSYVRKISLENTPWSDKDNSSRVIFDFDNSNNIPITILGITNRTWSPFGFRVVSREESSDEDIYEGDYKSKIRKEVYKNIKSLSEIMDTVPDEYSSDTIYIDEHRNYIRSSQMISFVKSFIKYIKRNVLKL